LCSPLFKESAVFQDTFTLAYSVAENVALNEQWDEEKVWECLEKSGLSQKVTALPQGLSANLGKELSQDGVRLSGGETQKLLLARALYRDPSTILLDEPTAALDALAESEIYEIYNRTLADITALFISHRLASTRFCEEILLLSDGRIADSASASNAAVGSSSRIMDGSRYNALAKSSFCVHASAKK